VSHSVLLGLILGSLTAETRINFRNSVLSKSQFLIDCCHSYQFFVSNKLHNRHTQNSHKYINIHKIYTMKQNNFINFECTLRH
jgi:hypothetical protein